MKKLLFALLFGFIFTSCVCINESKLNEQIRKDFPEAILYEGNPDLGKIIVVTRDSIFLVQVTNYVDSVYIYETEPLTLIESVVTSFPKEEPIKSEPSVFIW